MVESKERKRRLLTKMEVVVLGVANCNQEDQEMNKGFEICQSLRSIKVPQSIPLTLCGRLVTKMLGSVAANEARRFEYRGWTSR